MIDILTYISDQLDSIDIPYEFGEWTQDVSYPYFVGTFTEIEHRYEDGYTGGNMTIDGWARGSGAKLQLAQASDKIKELFDDNRAVVDGAAFLVSFSSSAPVPSGEDDLFRVTISLDTKEWKGA